MSCSPAKPCCSTDNAAESQPLKKLPKLKKLPGLQLKITQVQEKKNEEENSWGPKVYRIGKNGNQMLEVQGKKAVFQLPAAETKE